MLRHRLIFGTVLAAAMLAILVGDAGLGPWYPCLLGCVVLAAVPAVRELVRLFPADVRPPLGLCLPAVLAVLLANWAPVVSGVPPWPVLATVVAVSVIVAFLVEMSRYDGSGRSTPRVANAAFCVAYLGLLPSFFVQLRWLPDVSGLALTLAVFVPKCCDIGAYTTGRLIGRTPFSPRLSPKKTWEGIAGGMVFAVLTAVGLSFAGPVFRHGVPEAVAFGLVVGFVGVFGDLAESMVKRDAGAKDAAASVPGFGGVLDVIDSVVFAGPPAYLWLARPG